MIRRIIICLSLTLIMIISVACADEMFATGYNPKTSAISDTTSDEETGISSVAPAGLTYSVDQNGQTMATGMTSEGIQVSTVILANRDIYAPGEGSSYAIQFVPFGEDDREPLTGENWTLIEERSESYSNGDPDYDGTAFFDTYKDAEDTVWNHFVLPMNISIFTTRGSIFYALATSRGAMPSYGEDLPFTSPKEAFQQAETYFAEAGFSVSDSYEIFRISKDWLDKNAKLSTFYGDDMTDYNELYPNGLQKEDNAYLFYLRRDVNGLPLLSQAGATALVTDKGVEYAALARDFSIGEVIESGKMISFEKALFTVSNSLFSGNINDAFCVMIYMPYTNDPKSEKYGIITPSPDGSLVTYGTVSIDKAELGLLPVVEGEHDSGTAIPCWEFHFVWTEDPNDPKSGTSSCWATVNALTGEYIPFIMSEGEI